MRWIHKTNPFQPSSLSWFAIGWEQELLVCQRLGTCAGGVFDLLWSKEKTKSSVGEPLRYYPLTPPALLLGERIARLQESGGLTGWVFKILFHSMSTAFAVRPTVS